MNQGTLIRDFNKKHIAEKNKQINFIAVVEEEYLKTKIDLDEFLITANL